MDASRIFESVLNSIEQSQLNYLLTRTPFSATICLKRSFSKQQRKPVHDKRKVDEFIVLEEKVKALEKKLNDVELEKSRIEDLYKQEKNKVKEAAETEGQFREEMLKVKSEKKTLSSQVKSLKVKCDNVEEEIKSIQLDKKELATQLKSTVQRLATFQSKVEELTGEKDNSEAMIENLVLNVKNLKDQIESSDPCSFCDKKFENRSELKVHFQDEHFTSQGTQCEGLTSTQDTVQNQNVEESPVKEFLVYKCFYCQRTLMSGEELKRHRRECLMICAICDAQCRDDTDLQLHMYQYHIWTIPNYLCSECPTNFRCKETLQSHKKYSHGSK